MSGLVVFVAVIFVSNSNGVNSNVLLPLFWIVAIEVSNSNGVNSNPPSK